MNLNPLCPVCRKPLTWIGIGPGATPVCADAEHGRCQPRPISKGERVRLVHPACFVGTEYEYVSPRVGEVTYTYSSESSSERFVVVKFPHVSREIYMPERFVERAV